VFCYSKCGSAQSEERRRFSSSSLLERGSRQASQAFGFDSKLKPTRVGRLDAMNIHFITCGAAPQTSEEFVSFPRFGLADR